MNFLADDIEYVRTNSTSKDRLNMLAEECCELAQAALKIERAMGEGQYCAKSYDECLNNLKEEIADVNVCLATIVRPQDRSDIEQIAKSKMNRWCNRLSDMKKG